MNCGVIFHNLELPLVNYLQGNLTRNLDNTIYNLKARISNFSKAYWYHRVFGLLLYCCWSFIPGQLRNFVYLINVYSKNIGR
jgi:hypothetical protein